MDLSLISKLITPEFGFLCFFGLAGYLVRSQFPDQGLNPGREVKTLRPNHPATRELPDA